LIAEGEANLFFFLSNEETEETESVVETPLMEATSEASSGRTRGSRKCPKNSKARAQLDRASIFFSFRTVSKRKRWLKARPSSESAGHPQNRN
jgi:hypothetical protein